MQAQTTRKQGLANAIEGAFGEDDEAARQWVGEARRLEVQLDEALEVGSRLCRYMASGATWSAWDQDAMKNDVRHWRELVKAVGRANSK